MNRWLFTILSKAISLASPSIIENLRQLVEEMMVKAEGTPNPWDDIIVGMIQMLVGKPGETQLPAE